MLICITCGEERELGRRECRECFRATKRARHHAKYKVKGRYYREAECLACAAAFKAWRKTQVLCPSCYKISITTNYIPNQYPLKAKTALCEHRVLVEQLLGRGLTYNEVVHHIDEDVQNNDPANLMVLSRRDHGRLHTFLRLQRMLNDPDTWDLLKITLSLKWLKEHASSPFFIAGELKKD